MTRDSDQNDKTQTHIVLTKGTEVGHYRIIEKIGAGDMAEAYLAEDDELNRRVARIAPNELDSRNRLLMYRRQQQTKHAAPA